MWAFSSCGEWGLLFAAVCRLLIAVASLVVDCRLYRYELQLLWHAGSEVVAHRHVESFHVPCTGRSILIHCTTREVQYNSCFFFFFTVIVSLQFNMHQYLLKLKSESVSCRSLALQVDSIPSEPRGKPIFSE